MSLAVTVKAEESSAAEIRSDTVPEDVPELLNCRLAYRICAEVGKANPWNNIPETSPLFPSWTCDEAIATAPVVETSVVMAVGDTYN